MCLNKIAQNVSSRKLKQRISPLLPPHALFLFAAVICSAALIFTAGTRGADKWDRGWKAWKSGSAEKALEEWSSGALLAPFDPGAPRIYYWRVRALEKMGRKKEASLAASAMASRFPLDFYSIVLAGEDRYPFLSQAVSGACAASACPRRWEREVAEAAARTGVSKNILFAMIRQESNFNEQAVSRSGAVGLMQLMPGTAREAAFRLKKTGLSADDPAHNVMLGASHFARLCTRFGGCLPLALAAYNAGEANVLRWGPDPDKWMEWIEDIPFRETRVYVRTVLKNYALYTATDSSGGNEKLTYALLSALAASLPSGE